MSRRSCAIQRKIRQYQKWTVKMEGPKRVLVAQRPDYAEAKAAVTQPGKFPRRIEKEG